jgi:hypothetical protein
MSIPNSAGDGVHNVRNRTGYLSVDKRSAVHGAHDVLNRQPNLTLDPLIGGRNGSLFRSLAVHVVGPW